MNAWRVFFGVVGLAVACSTCPAPAQDMRRPKKLIATGWDMPDTARLRENLEQMERRPFDGVVLEAVGRRDDGRPCRLRLAFVEEPWQEAWFESCIDDLKACRFQRFTDNFLLVNANPGRVDWFDDAGWESIVDHWRIAARVAKQSGCKGILFDPEPYTPPYAQFRYAAQPRRRQHPFEEYYRKARQRGEKVIRAVAEEDPQITVFCYFLNSVAATAAGRADPRPGLAALGYGLLPPFVDGWLDAAPPTLTFVDGCESAYRYNSRADFLQAAVRIRGDCQELVSPENRAKYRAQVQVGFGLYLDAYWNPKDSKWAAWYIDGLGGPRVERLRANARTALAVADRYVWIYGEKFRWWPTPHGRVREQTWPQALPGCEKALRYARDPLEYAREEIAAMKQAGGAENLARNGDFAARRVEVAGREQVWREGRPPAGWAAWQEEASQGSFRWDRQAGASAGGAARAAQVANGCFLQHHEVEAGERYAVRAVCRRQGEGRTWVRVRWQTTAGAWTAQARDQLAFCPGPPDQWSEIFAVVEVPEGADRLVILLGVGGQGSADDVAWFDDVELYRLP